MKEESVKIGTLISNAATQLAKINEDQASQKLTQQQWSKKEILGHLIDSAANNHQRIVRASYNEAGQFPPYSQNDWVRIQNYNQISWTELIAFWTAYNNHLIRIIAIIPESAKAAPCNIGKDEPVTLEFVVKDYVRHLKHHLDQLL